MIYYQVYKRQKTFIEKEDILKMYSNSLSHKTKILIEAGNIIIAMLLLLFLGITIKTWGFGFETLLLLIFAFYLMITISITILEIEFDLEFLVAIMIPIALGCLVPNLTLWILMVFLCCLIIIIKIRMEKRQEINQVIDSVKNFTEALFGEIYGPVVLIGTIVFAIVFHPFANWIEIAYIIMLILVEILLCLLVANKEKIASISDGTIMPLFLFIITILILVIYYLGFIEIVFIAIGLSFLLYSVIKIQITIKRDD